MIRLATVFSGIGAIEQALIRLNIDHEVEFACDNGGIEIEIDYPQELSRIKAMGCISEKRDYVRNLYKEKSRKTNFVEKSFLANYNVKGDNFFYDIKLLDGEDFKGKVDLFVGGSPCQSFSAIGTRLGLEDARGTLFYEYARLIKEIQPRVFIYENVHGVLSHDKGSTWSIMKNIFDEIGYHWTYEVLDAKNHGIPQSRRRVFAVGFQDIHDFSKFNFPESRNLEYKLHDFLLDNVADGKFISRDGRLTIDEKVPQEIPESYYLSPKLIKYCLSPGTKNFMHHDAKIDLPIARALLSTMGNSHRSSVNNYVTTKGRVRALHPRETHRLMGFPDSYKIVVSKAQAYKQSGNSIVVDVLMDLVKAIFPEEI
jgi:DNA (cytosine-5)-methyltransferase 1